MTDNDKETVLVCSPISDPLLLPDNEAGRCSECNRRIQFRPGLAMRKICYICAGPAIEDGASVGVTQKTLDELADYLRKKLS